MKYPGGQADADVTTHVAAKIVTSAVKILVIFMANLLIMSNRERHFACNQS
jgi:hypothetical protein